MGLRVVAVFRRKAKFRFLDVISIIAPKLLFYLGYLMGPYLFIDESLV